MKCCVLEAQDRLKPSGKRGWQVEAEPLKGCAGLGSGSAVPLQRIRPQHRWYFGRQQAGQRDNHPIKPFHQQSCCRCFWWWRVRLGEPRGNRWAVVVWRRAAGGMRIRGGACRASSVSGHSCRLPGQVRGRGTLWTPCEPTESKATKNGPKGSVDSAQLNFLEARLLIGRRWSSHDRVIVHASNAWWEACPF